MGRFAFLFLFFVAFSLSAHAADTDSNRALLLELQQFASSNLKINHSDITGKVNFIGVDRPGGTVAGLSAAGSPASAQALGQVAQGYMIHYGPLFGLKDASKDLRLDRVKSASAGRSFTRFQQLHQGVPVIGGEMVVQLDARSNLMSANGEVVPDPVVDMNPSVSASQAIAIARAVVTKNYQDAKELTATVPELWIYNPAVFRLPFQKNFLVWRMEIRSGRNVDELVLVDARSGDVLLHFSQIETAKRRDVYNTFCAATLPGTRVRSEGNPATGVIDQDSAFDFAGLTYDFYFTEHGRDGITGTGDTITSTVNYDTAGGDCNYQNAFWSGAQIVYGTGWSRGLDLVGHELTHGVTDSTSRLYYYMQSGAINESFSDIWGELIELTFNPGPASERWLLFENIAGGPIRNMSNPPAFSHPDRMRSPLYVFDAGDAGGVHTNSGVGNKAAQLMVDGGAFNGFTITGLGISKVVDLYYEVQTNLMTSAGDYADLYVLLQQAAVNLGYSSSDRQQILNALDATEMNLQSDTAPATEAPIGGDGKILNTIFFDDMEDTLSGNWTHSATTGVDLWVYPDSRYAVSGRVNISGTDADTTADYSIAMTRDILLPQEAYLRFNHAYDFENQFDGGIVEYSTNGGITWTDAKPLFLLNGYNNVLFTGTGNPLGGKSAFTGTSFGYRSSRADLSSLSGKSARFRFRIATDVSIGARGWFIDDVRIYSLSTDNLRNVFVYPNPYIPFDNDPQTGKPFVSGDLTTGIVFGNLTTSVTIEIYTMTGLRVKTIINARTEGSVHWDVRNENGQDVASDVYYAVIRSDFGARSVQKFMVIR